MTGGLQTEVFTDTAPTMPIRERFDIPASIHPILQRWAVFLTLLEDAPRAGGDSVLAILQRLAQPSRPQATRHDITALGLYIYLTLEAIPDMPMNIRSEALAISAWVQPLLRDTDD